MSRRSLIAIGAGAATMGIVVRSQPGCAAEPYPDKPILLINGYAAGGSGDITARIAAEGMGKYLKRSVVVEDKPGASSMIALEYTAHSTPDGYTLSLATDDATSMLWAVRPKEMPFNLRKDLTFIARLVEQNYLLVVNTKWPFKSLAQFVTYAKANPRQLRCGTIGYGSSTHLAALLFQQRAGIELTFVPYLGGMASMPDILAGNIDCAFLTVTDVLSAGKTNKIVELAVASPVREPLLPGVPTMAEAGYLNASKSTWLGLIGPSNLPVNVQTRLDGVVTKVLKDSDVISKFEKLGLRPAPLFGDAFRKAVIDEYGTWESVVKAAHMASG